MFFGFWFEVVGGFLCGGFGFLGGVGGFGVSGAILISAVSLAATAWPVGANPTAVAEFVNDAVTFGFVHE